MIELMTGKKSKKLLLLELLNDLKMIVVRVCGSCQSRCFFRLLVVPDSGKNKNHERLEYLESELARERNVLK
jgi:hypothetical protein